VFLKASSGGHKGRPLTKDAFIRCAQLTGMIPIRLCSNRLMGVRCLSKGEFYAYHLILSVLENRGLEGSVIETKSRTTLRGKGRKSRRGK
jgi:hypothetical protein